MSDSEDAGDGQQATTAQTVMFMVFFVIVLAAVIWLTIYNRKYQLQRNEQIGNTLDRGFDDFEKYLAIKAQPAAAPAAPAPSQ